MWHDFTLREVERHLQGDQDGELKRNQLPPADPEALLQLLQSRHNRNQSMRDRQETENMLNLLCIFYFIFTCLLADKVQNFVPLMLKCFFVLFRRFVKRLFDFCVLSDFVMLTCLNQHNTEMTDSKVLSNSFFYFHCYLLHMSQM